MMRQVEITTKASPRLRQQIMARDGKTCQYCGMTGPGRYVVEHIVPQRRGGGHHPANLVVSCWSCNKRKDNEVWVPRNFDTITMGDVEWQRQVHALAEAPYIPDEAGEMFSVRVRPSTKRAIDGYIHGAKLKKGPTTDALWDLLMHGYIDVKMVREHIRKMKGDDA